MSRFKKIVPAVLLSLGLVSAAADQAAEIEVEMLNRGPGGMMSFEPTLVKIAPGDTVHFVADKGHNVESIDSMLPSGAQPFAGKLNEELTVAFDKPGVYGFRCKPHYGLGMVGLVVVGDPANEDAAKAADNPGSAKKAFAKLFEQLDAQKTASAK